MPETLERMLAPKFGEIEKIDMLKATATNLDNGIPLYHLSGGSQDVLKLELIFNAGKWYQPKPLVAYAANSLMDDGTSSKSSAEIADALDFYGAFFQSKSDFDFGHVILYCQVKHLEKLLPLLTEIMTDAVFPEKEMETFRQNNKQKLIQNMERVEVLAGNSFQETIYGKNHPYGNINRPEDYEELKRGEVVNFYQSQYTLADSKIIISGKVSANVIRLVNAVLGNPDLLKRDAAKSKEAGKQNQASPASQKKQFIKKDNAVQSAIIIGKPMMNKTHPDFHGMLVLNTILGGYFGSRLMTNIREDKGYTYGIHSSLSSHIHGGCMQISTEVGASVTRDAVKEIFAEIQKLTEEKVPAEELQLVKNYLAGSFMRSIDGPFALADRFAGILNYGLGYDYYENYFRTLKNISSEDVLLLAKKYFSRDEFYEVVAGTE